MADRILVYALQSSGASLFTYMLSQIPNSIGIIDVWAEYCTPEIKSPYPVIAKAVPTAKYSLEDHVRSFQPTKKILFIRNPYDNYISLNDKPYRDEAGTLEEKFSMMDEVFRDRETFFDGTYFYEDFVNNPVDLVQTIRQTITVDIPVNAHQLNRTLDDISDFNQRHCGWCKDTYRSYWGFGNIHKRSPNHIKVVTYNNIEPRIKRALEEITPCLYSNYQSREFCKPSDSDLL